MPVIVTSAGPSRWRAVLPAVFAAVAAWLSSGAIAFRNPSGARIGVLPIQLFPFAVAALAALVVFAIGIRDTPVSRLASRASLVAVSPLALIVIPWLPLWLPLRLPLWLPRPTPVQLN